MKQKISVPIHESITSDDVKRRIKKAGMRNLSIKEAEEQGVFSRVSFLLCAMHSLTTVSYRLLGEVDMWFCDTGVKKHEIKRELNRFYGSYDKWFSFWRDYQDAAGIRDMNNDCEALYRQFMDWADLPLYWELGDEQRVKRETEPMIVIEEKDRLLNLYRDIAVKELLGEIEEEWGVMRADFSDNRYSMQCVEKGMDKASAAMCAKRMSVDDTEHMYVASCLQGIEEKRVEVVPIKAYRRGEMVGNTYNVIKKNACR